MSYYVYVLQSQKDHGLYIGHTNDLSRRLKEHNGKSKATKSTSYRSPFTLIYQETHLTRTEAIAREKFWKQGYNRERLKKLIQN